jgi:hypothetical protein
MKPRPRRYSWRCWLCAAWDNCESGLAALAGFEKHYAAAHAEKLEA